ncbi:uncharacterized protein LOC129870986 [Solanum dulcamara]|uniref:uncharacterized protein LOC129870986 n=1 Tax=Solanum dulcamara TaxID=45834 RepID=UPI00248620E0|nr:uncharacterized protein LOC129870986 [Solanum dulcamara]XP_055801828.1 uncharacterized protein LOC129870986 [Solanum dulcamara]
MGYPIQSDIRSAIQIAAVFRHHNNHYHHLTNHRRLLPPAVISYRNSPNCCFTVNSALKLRAFSINDSDTTVQKVSNKPSLCTADELHYVSVNNSDWKLALWRYIPPPQAPKRNHPLLLLSGVGTNAIGYDLAPGSSFARYMSGEGFDTWVLELRGAGLSVQESDSTNIEKTANAVSEQMEAAADNATDKVLSAAQQSTDAQSTLEESDIAVVKEEPTAIATMWDESRVVNQLTETFMLLSERVSGFLNESQSRIMSAKLFDQISKLLEDSFLYESFNETRGKLLSLLETRQNSAVADQVKDLSQKLVNIIEEGQRSVSPLVDLHERLTTTIEDFQKQLDLIVKYDWDFDHYLEEDVPAAMEYIKAQTAPKDGKLLAIGHSMGGILLYARLSQCGLEEREPGLTAVVTLASSLDYTSSKSALRLLLPLADPAQALNVPVVPLGALLAAAYPLSSRPPYVLSWLNDLISAADMMHPELLKKLVLNNFCTIPAKLILQLTTAFREGGLRDRSGKIFYKDNLHKSNVPVLAVAGDKDIICPPEAVYETAKFIPEHLVTYKVFGDANGQHYAHYDLVGGRMAAEHLYPCIIQFLSRYDDIS